MMDNLGDFKCLFCNAQVLITDLREYLSAAKYKQLADKEISHLFDLEIAMLDATKAALDEEQRIIEMEIVIKWLRKDGMDDTQILHALVEMGYMKEGPSKHLSFVHMCPKCNELLPTGSAARRAEGGALPRKPQAERSSVPSVATELAGSPYTCDSCKAKICSICIEEAEPGHTCNKDMLETIKHIHATCETCPKCHSIIEKESGGCDQMFCTKCNTTFSWTTRRILTKDEVRHNPHFYDWQRQQKEGVRNPLDNPCEGHFLIKCQDKLNNVEVLPEKLDETPINNEKPKKRPNISVTKGSYLKFVQGMLIHSVETIVGIQERDDFIRQQFRARYLTKHINFKRWRRRFKQHINTLRRNNETKTLLLACLDSLYYIVLEADADIYMIKQLFYILTVSLKAVQDHYGRTLNYLISTENVMLPYMT